MTTSTVLSCLPPQIAGALLAALLLLSPPQGGHARFYNTIPFTRRDAASAEEIFIARPALVEANQDDGYGRRVREVLRPGADLPPADLRALPAAAPAVRSAAASPITSADGFNTHLIALRPDYAFRNVANVLRNFFDARIERHRKGSQAASQAALTRKLRSSLLSTLRKK